MATILVVDDRQVDRELLATLLTQHGHRVLEASDGAEALALVLAERPDLVITDILMPTMDGFEFVRQLRALAALARTPVVFYSATYHEREARALAAACGIADILHKPTEPETILQKVNRVLGLAPPPPPPPAEEFDREHLRVVTDKLAQKVADLEVVNQRLSALIELSLQIASQRDPQRLLQHFAHAAREWSAPPGCLRRTPAGQHHDAAG